MLQPLQQCLKVVNVFFVCLTRHDDIVQIRRTEVQISSELLHIALKNASRASGSERKPLVLEQFEFGVDYSQFLRKFIQWDLEVSVRQVHLREKLTALQLVEEFLNPRNWMAIDLELWIYGDFEIAADSQTTVRFLDQNYRCCLLTGLH